MQRSNAGFLPGWTMALFLLVPLTRCYSLRIFGSWGLQIILLFGCCAAMAVHILYRYGRVPVPFHPTDALWVLFCGFLLVRNRMIGDGYYIDAAFCLLAMAYALTLRCETAGFAAFRRMTVAFALFYAAMTWLSFWFPSFYLAHVVPLLPATDQSQVYVAFTQYGEYMGFTNHYSRNAYYQTLGMIVLLTGFIAGNPRHEVAKAAMLAFLGATLLLVGKRGHAFFLAFSFLTTYVVRRRPSLMTFVKAGGIAVIGVLLALFATLVIPGAGRLAERLFSSSGTDFTTGRIELYARAWAMFRENPLFGNGWGAFTRSTGYEVIGVHNDYIQLLAEVGVVGTCVVLAANFGTYAMTWRLMRALPREGADDGAGALVTLSFFFQTFFLSYSFTGVPRYDYEVFMIYFLLCGAAFAVRLGRPE